MSMHTAAALLVLTCRTVLAVAGPAPGSAQVPAPDERRGTPDWSLFDAVGYGGLGFGVGFMVAPKDLGSIGAGAAMIAAGGVAGLVFGARLGGRAEAAIERGEEITPGLRNGVVGGVVLAGSALGALYAWRNSDGLAPRRVDVAPALIGGRQVGVGIHLRF